MQLASIGVHLAYHGWIGHRIFQICLFDLKDLGWLRVCQKLFVVLLTQFSTCAFERARMHLCENRKFPLKVRNIMRWNEPVLRWLGKFDWGLRVEILGWPAWASSDLPIFLRMGTFLFCVTLLCREYWMGKKTGREGCIVGMH